MGVDGEGGDDADGRHHYYLLRVGDEVLETGKPLTHWECFEFLAGLDPTNIYVAYFFDYDVTMMCATMTPYKMRRLLDREARFTPGSKYHTPLPVDVGPFEIDYVAGKFFKVRYRTPPGEKNRQWVEISDVGAFFQQAFVKSLRDWGVGNVEEVAEIVEGKEARAEFGNMTDDIRRYNRLEVDLLERLMNKFRSTCQAIGHLPAKWQGPGDLASAFLQYHRVPKKHTLPLWEDPDFREFWKFADRSYYGGRFETSAVGRIPGPVYNVDINSAYPFSLTHVPCLTHGRWEHTGTGKMTRGSLSLWEGYFEPRPRLVFPPDPVLFYGLPFRNHNGGVSYPGHNGGGVYWSFEVEASKHQLFTLTDSWTYRRECDCETFPWVYDLYRERLRLKKDSQGKVLKLALNSLYGKTAQRIGGAPYNNYVWSSFITAHTRTMLLDFMHSLPSCRQGRCGDDVWMLATDGIYTSTLPDGFEPNGELGGWDLKEYPDGIFIVQPGVYFDNAPGEQTRLTRTRGLPVNMAVEYEGEIRAAFEELYKSGDPTAVAVPIPVTTFTGIRQGMHRRKPDLIGQWRTEERNITFDWRSKRDPKAIPCGGYLRTRPLEGSLLDMSRPYDRELAKMLDEKRLSSNLNFFDQPDFRAQIVGAIQEEL